MKCKTLCPLCFLFCRAKLKCLGVHSGLLWVDLTQTLEICMGEVTVAWSYSLHSLCQVFVTGKSQLRISVSVWSRVSLQKGRRAQSFQDGVGLLHFGALNQADAVQIQPYFSSDLITRWPNFCQIGCLMRNLRRSHRLINCLNNQRSGFGMIRWVFICLQFVSNFPHGCCQKILYRLYWACINLVKVVFLHVVDKTAVWLCDKKKQIHIGCISSSFFLNFTFIELHL